MSTRSTNAEALGFGGLRGKVAIISGATRGIGRECALALAREGCHIAIAAKSIVDTKELPGTIYSVADEINQIGVRTGSGSTGLAVRMDVLDAESIVAAVDKTVERFGRVDICINNASALWWQPISETPLKKFDLINRLNARGSFILTQACLPHMKKSGFGRVITMSPPISNDYRHFKGMTAYNMSKFGMTMVALGVSAEFEDVDGVDITGNSLWPATVIESQASINFSMGERRDWRKATILADATVAIICDPAKPRGQMLFDDTYLLSRGLSKENLACYRYDPAYEPPRFLAGEGARTGEGERGSINRGDVRKLAEDQKRDGFSASKL